jgi:hypothetical protein
MADTIAQIARTVSRIAICDREIGRLNATSTSGFGYIRPVLSGRRPLLRPCFATVWSGMRSLRSLGCRHRQLRSSEAIRPPTLPTRASGLRRPVERPSRCGELPEAAAQLLS